MGTKPEFLKSVIFADQPVNWLVHAEGFYFTGLKLIESYENLSRPKFISAKENFEFQYMYKIAIYLLSHSIELLLKAIISSLNQNTPTSFKPPAKYSHKIIDMAKDLEKYNIITFDKKDYEILELINEYLKWFGRYYSPHITDIPKIIEEAYSEADEKGLIEFKYKINYPDTHQDLIKLYQALKPPIDTNTLSLTYLFQQP